MRNILYLTSVLLALGMLWFAYYAISPIFRTVKVDEAFPVAQKEMPTREKPKPQTASPVIGTTGHPASGTARVVTAEGKKFVRYENFKTINGPDLFVYLANDLGAKEFVNLGVLRATEGNVNYEIPEAVDPADYRYVLTWCKQFGVLFNYADISLAE